MSLTDSRCICRFRLEKWLSNPHNLLSSLPLSELSPKIVNLDLSSQVIQRALGVSLDIEHDILFFKPIEKGMPVTKRGILSLVSSIFDPLGILTPSILQTNLITQDFWRKNNDWN